MTWIVSSTLTAAARWGWITSNPAESVKKPRRTPARPDPPTAAEAARIIVAAWAQYESWGARVWLVMVTSHRKGGEVGQYDPDGDTEPEFLLTAYTFAFWRLCQQPITHTTLPPWRNLRSGPPACRIAIGGLDRVRVIQLRTREHSSGAAGATAGRRCPPRHRFPLRMHKVHQYYPSLGIHKII